MILGEIFPAPGAIEINAGLPVTVLMVANTGDRPVQVGSHYHFAETNPGLSFDRAAAGTVVRFEPGQSREVRLVPYQGHRSIFGFNGHGWGNWRESVSQTSNQTRELRDGNARTNGADHESYR